VAEWDNLINSVPHIQELFFAFQNDYRLATSGITYGSHEDRVAEEIRQGAFDTQAAMINAQAAAQNMAAGSAGDPDPVVFPGQPVARLSQYVGMMKRMQTGDMMGAMGQYGLNMATFGQVAQAWGVKLASDPILNAKFAQMMQ
jgi:hypothetical protein